ncbi:hypothetical protein Ddye_032140 [Dipteronia dyeriana]|uniref:Uncharacterized protein n=1 Tax=Dipteronia dyeriana TaxID=168575 RepID=A0AAD9TK78_9ROSI|nr:hypothetical protein Ddye_032140 [Dipteronia dyeriana]
MEENETKVMIEIIPAPSSSEKEDEKDDCLILDCDPFDSINDINKLSMSDYLPNNDEDNDDLQVISEIGQVACRDYPHPRHLCIKYPFDKTPHDNRCELCYCYVCDSTAPCNFWTEADDDDQEAHCHASEHIGDWKNKRNLKKQINID